MTQGIAHARLGHAARAGLDLKEWRDEVCSFFASGTQTQELYITPRMLTPAMWDVLAEGARWSRRNADVLADVHWIGGDPAKRGLRLRRLVAAAGDAGAEEPCGVGRIAGGRHRHGLRAARRGGAAVPGSAARGRMPSAEALRLRAGQPHTFKLAPFEVLVLDAAPVPAAPAREH